MRSRGPGWERHLGPSLPELKGSPKQVAWARELRQRMLKEAEDFVSGMTASDADRARLIADFKEALNRLRTRQSALYWIERRKGPIEDVLFNEAYLLPKPRSDLRGR